MPGASRYRSIEEALDHAQQVLSARFGKPDQRAAVMLAHALYTLQERERFDERGEPEDIPYRL